MIDVDGFKLFNDRHGHQAGDDCLRIVATELTLFARRSEDLIGRYGGEEFIVGLPGLRGEDAMRHAERIRAAIADLAMPELGIRRGDVTVSIGVSSVIPSPSMTADTLVAMADVALYEAKRAGRNRTSLFQESGVPGAHQAA
jgi:diguanylate cyclase (GGDEF)-like protein